MKEKQYTSPSEPHVVGNHLQKLRQEQALTLEDVTQATKVSLSNLRAIESMAYGKLPADIFTKGQITLYGNFLGVDGRKMADQFFFERDGGKKTGPFLKKNLPNHSLTPKQLAEPTHISSAAIAGFLLVLIIVSFTGFCFYTSWNPFAFLTDQTKNLSSSVINTFHPANPATSNRANLQPVEVDALFLKDSQVIISVDNAQSVQKVYTRGTSVHWKAEKQIHVEFFQPDSAELQLNSTPLPFPREDAGRYILRIPPATP